MLTDYRRTKLALLGEEYSLLQSSAARSARNGSQDFLRDLKRMDEIVEEIHKIDGTPKIAGGPRSSVLGPFCASCGVELTPSNTAPGCGVTCVLCIS